MIAKEMKATGRERKCGKLPGVFCSGEFALVSRCVIVQIKTEYQIPYHEMLTYQPLTNNAVKKNKS